jgi:hypothetical protein
LSGIVRCTHTKSRSAREDDTIEEDWGASDAEELAEERRHRIDRMPHPDDGVHDPAAD